MYQEKLIKATKQIVSLTQKRDFEAVGRWKIVASVLRHLIACPCRHSNNKQGVFCKSYGDQ